MTLLEFVLGHVVGVADVGQSRLLQIERGFLPGCRVVVLERDIAFPLRIEQCGIGIERARLFRQEGKGVALQHGRHPINLVVVTDELESGFALAQEFLEIGILAPVRKARRVDRLDQIVFDQRLLHAPDDVDDVIGALAAAGHQHVEYRRWRVADRNQVDVPTAWRR